MSEVFQIDLYRNNKFQYIFNTANKLFVIDRNGNHVAKFPVNLPAVATNGITVYDYDNNKDYRIFLAMANNQVLLFDKNGNRIAGFNPSQIEGSVTSPIQFFSSGGRDFIVFSDEYNNYFLDRRGNSRITSSQSFIRNPKSSFYLHDDGNDNYLITTTQSGSLVKISLTSGDCTIKEFFKCPKEHYFTLIRENT